MPTSFWRSIAVKVAAMLSGEPARVTPTPSSTPSLPLSAPPSPLRRPLPHNNFTPDEIAQALCLLTKSARLSPPARVTVVWSKRFSRVIKPEEVANINDPERIKRISVDCTFPGVRESDPATHVSGDLVRPRLWGFERRGAIVVEGGGHARSSLNAAMSHLAGVRPWTAGIRRGLTSAIPAFIIVLSVGTGIPIATFFLAPERLESPSLSGPTTVRIYVTDILLGGLYYFTVFLYLGGTRIVNSSTIVGRSWLTPTVIIGLLALLTAVTALTAPVIGVIVAIIK